MTDHSSKGERILQREFGTTRRASAFYEKQMLDHLNPTMREFISHRELVFIATAVFGIDQSVHNFGGDARHASQCCE